MTGYHKRTYSSRVHVPCTYSSPVRFWGRTVVVGITAVGDRFCSTAAETVYETVSPTRAAQPTAHAARREDSTWPGGDS